MHSILAVSILISLVKCIDGTFICKNDGMFEHPNDPNAFWHCAHGISYLKYCPPTLIWSQAGQHCTWNTVQPTTIVTTSLPPTTITSTEIPSTTTLAPSSLPPECSNYMSITDGTRRTDNTNLAAETDHSYFSSTPSWVRFEGAAGTRLADYSVPSNRCGSEGAGWIKHSIEPTIGMTANQTVCFNWSGFSCIWPLKIPMTNCDGFFVYGLVAPALSNGRYCTI